MTSLGILLSILSVTPGPEPSRGAMYIIVGRPHAYLEVVLQRAFEERENVKVIVDRRYGERRTGRRPVGFDRRRADRRTVKEPLAELIMTEESSGS